MLARDDFFLFNDISLMAIVCREGHQAVGTVDPASDTHRAICMHSTVGHIHRDELP